MPADVEIGPGLAADALCETEAERASLAAFREVVGEAENPIERHGVRMLYICERIAADRGLEVDREVLLVAGILHDIGLYEKASRGGVYVTDGRDFAEPILIAAGWVPGRIRLCLDAIEHHHRLTPQWELGDEVELMRRADLVELSAGVINFGIERSWLRELGRAVPRTGAYGEIARKLGRMARERPATMPRIFFAGR